MTKLESGSSRKGMLSQEDYLAPPHIPTGQPPKDVLNVIWRKNEVFLDIGNYSIGSAMMMIWPVLILAILILWSTGGFGGRNLGLTALFSLMLAIPILALLYSLIQPAPLPTRFNRQRREVCVPQKDGSYWFVPWEQVEAQAVAVNSIGQHGKTTQGMLVVGFTNPDPAAKEQDKHHSIGFSCGGGTTAMRLWECMRSYMEIGPDAVSANTQRFHLSKGIWETYIDDVIEAAREKGWFKALFWEGACGLVLFNTPLIDFVERVKLSPLPDLINPAIVEWSKPLPPEQWVERSLELGQAIAMCEADLARSFEMYDQA